MCRHLTIFRLFLGGVWILFFFFTVMAHRKLQESCNKEQDSERSAAGLNGSLVGNLAVESYSDLNQLLC